MMQLWIPWWKMIWALRPACSRTRSFLWFAVMVAGMTIRTDQLGVTSVVRALGLKAKCYDALREAMHSSSISLDRMTVLWSQAVLRFFPGILRVRGRIVLLGDGIKIPKRGRKMPAVKLLHQQSESNTKPEYIMGHSFQALSILVSAAQSVFAVPLASRIHEGLVLSNRCQKTLLDKMVELLSKLTLTEPCYLVMDAYYASRKVIVGLHNQGHHLVTKVRRNAVAYEKPIGDNKPRKRGRPRKYGRKIALQTLFREPAAMQTAQSPVYGETDISLQYRVLDLLWRPAGSRVRFVLVIHPNRGRCIFMSTDLSLEGIDIIRLYGLRFKIEVGFKQAVRTLGGYAYHFWMAPMKPLRRRQGDQYLHRESESYRKAVFQKMHAYHLFVHAGIVAQGLLQYLATAFPTQVWASFGSWLRTIRTGIPPSELVVATALRNTFPEFLLGGADNIALAKFIAERIDLCRSEGLRLAA